MRRDELHDILLKIIPHYPTTVVLTLHSGIQIIVDNLIRFDVDYVIIRGREGGSTDEGRAFFVPYGEISFLKIDTRIRANEIKRIYGESVEMDREELMNAATQEAANTDAPITASISAPQQPTDPASIAKQNLLERIRAARTSGGGGVNSPAPRATPMTTPPPAKPG